MNNWGIFKENAQEILTQVQIINSIKIDYFSRILVLLEIIAYKFGDGNVGIDI